MTCTPSRASGLPSGPIENGTTYIVRPAIDPAKTSSSSARITSGARQLLVGPASASSVEQMKVRDSTRATSSGLLRARKLYGRRSALSRNRVPRSTMPRISSSASRREPSHHTTVSGVVRWAIFSTQATTRGVGAFGRQCPGGVVKGDVVQARLGDLGIVVEGSCDRSSWSRVLPRSSVRLRG